MKRLKTLILTAAAGFAAFSATANCAVSGTVSAPENPFLICDGNLGTLTLSITGTPDSVQWLRSGTVVPGETGNSITLNKWSNGDYSALLWCGGSSTATTNSISVNKVFATNLNGTNDLCFGNTISFLAPSLSGASYEWYMNQLIAPPLSTTASFSTTTSGNVFLKITDNGCSKFAKVARIVNGVNCPVIAINTPEDPYIICGRDLGLLSITLPPGASYDSVQWFDDNVQIPGSGLSLNVNKWSVGEFHATIWFAGTSYNTQPIHLNQFHLTSNDTRICPYQQSHVIAPRWSTSATYAWSLDSLSPILQSGTGVGTGAPGGPDFYATPTGFLGNVWCAVTHNGCTKYAKLRILPSTNCPGSRPLDKMGEDLESSSLYPNPSNGNFTISLSGLNMEEPVSLTITDLNGRVVYSVSEVAAAENQIFEVQSELPTGIYAVKAVQQNFNFFTRAVVK